MDHAWYIYLLAIGAGALAGVVNTLAGSGSLITLPMLIFLGLPANVANGTNRVGIVIQNTVGVATLRRRGALKLSDSRWYVVPVLIGGAIGAFVAVDIGEQAMRWTIGVVMGLMLVVILADPKSWLAPEEGAGEGARDGRPPWWLLLAFVGIGAYGGFIQAGVGVLMLVGLVSGVGYDAARANGVKLFLNGLFTVVALVIFALEDQVVWEMGLLMGVGQALGAWGAARFAAGSERAGLWIRRLLIAIIVISMTELFGLWDLVGAWLA